MTADRSRLRTRMLAGLPIMTRTIDVGGTSTAVIEGGEGPPLLLLHGGIECGAAMWAPALGSLARHYHVVAPDVPGLGESAPLERLDLHQFGRWLAGVVAHTGLGRPTVVAHSLIGSLAAGLATVDGASMSRLLIYAAPAVGPYRMPLGLRYAAVRFSIRPSPRNAERFDRIALLDLGATRARDPAWYAAFDGYTRARASSRTAKRAMGRLVKVGTKPIADGLLDRIDVPTDLLWGRHDRMVPLAIGEHAAARHGWPLHVIENAAHAPHIEQPEAFVERLDAVLRA